LKLGSRRLNGRVALGGIGVCLAAALMACANQPQPPLPPVAPPPPVLTGHPAMPPETSAKPTTTKASYQSTRTAGLTTASGEPYDPNDLTAASRNLPIGSTVKVTNPETGRSVKVRINDRGPFVHGRSLDLSKRAAERIGIVHKGVARVKVTRVDSDTASDEPESPPSVAMPAAPVAMPPAAQVAMPAAQN
jgi:peptidoglycan lytic transglycosylase